MNRLCLNVSVVLFILACGVSVTTADTVGTAFTYQGVLSDAGASVQGTYDFRVFLYNADAGGGQVGSTVLVGGVAVIDGRVSLDLDFGDVFDGTSLWLEIHLRETGTATYTPLWPRQPLMATPFANLAKTAVWADDAGSALSADNATQLGGQSPSYYLAWSNLTGLPDGLDDGDDDTLADLSCSDGEIIRWTGTAWNCSSEESEWSSTYVVGPVGSALENGTALVAAVGSIPTATEASQRLVHLEPGTYDLGSGYLILPDWVSLEGGGRTQTIITSTFDEENATVNTGMDSLLQSVSVFNTATGTFSYAVKMNHRSRLLDVVAISEGNASRSRGVYSVGDDVVIENAHIEVLSGTADHSSYAIWGLNGMTLINLNAVCNGSAGLLGGISSIGTGPFVAKNLSVSATGTGTSVFGIRSTNPDIRLTDVFIDAQSTSLSATGFTATGTTGKRISMADVDVVATGGGAPYITIGVTLEIVDDPSVLNNVTAAGDSAGLVLDSGDGPVTIRDSQFSGLVTGLLVDQDFDALVTVRNSTFESESTGLGHWGPNTITIAASQVVTGNHGSGNIVCAGVWDDAHVFYPNSCP